MLNIYIEHLATPKLLLITKPSKQDLESSGLWVPLMLTLHVPMDLN
jgi:hypothetical protein